MISVLDRKLPAMAMVGTGQSEEARGDWNQDLELVGRRISQVQAEIET